MATLFLTIKKEWYEKIKSGEKTEEYREVKPYFQNRLFSKPYTHILFQNGYSKDSPRMLVQLSGIDRKEIFYPIDNQYKEVFALKIAAVISAD